MMSDYFISDLHLSDEYSETTEIFLRFLKDTAPKARKLYILGDLFDYWLGDDDDAPFNQKIITALKTLSKHTPVSIMPGNRDFLLGEHFAKCSGCTLLPDALLIQNTVLPQRYGSKILLLHGDTLCTDDHAYQEFRKQVRNPDYQKVLLSKPLDERRAIAKKIRTASQEENSLKSEAIMDVNPISVLETLKKYQVTTLLHGHTHRPAEHCFDYAPKEFEREKENKTTKAYRIVLPAWDAAGSVLKAQTDGFISKTL